MSANSELTLSPTPVVPPVRRRCTRSVVDGGVDTTLLNPNLSDGFGYADVGQHNVGLIRLSRQHRIRADE